MKNQKLPEFTDKNSVVKFEFNNISHIVLWSVSQKGKTRFWHITMNSALIMKYQVGSKAKIHFAVDHYMNNMQRLYMCYTDKHIPSIVKALDQLGIKTARRDDNFLVFELPEPVDSKQIKEWKHDSELAKRQIDELYKTNRNPDYALLYNTLRDLGNEIRVANRKMDGADRNCIGTKMMDLLIRAFELYHQLSSKDKGDDDGTVKRKMINCVNDMAFLADICGVQQVIDSKRMLRMGQLFNDVRDNLVKFNGVAKR
jgi:hypothetical protein